MCGAVARVRAPAHVKILAVAVALVAFAVVQLSAVARERGGVHRGGGSYGVAPRQRARVVDASDSTEVGREERGGGSETTKQHLGVNTTNRKPGEMFQHRASQRRGVTAGMTCELGESDRFISVVSHLASLCRSSNSTMSAGVFDPGGDGWVGGDAGATVAGVGGATGATGDGVRTGSGSGVTGEGVSGVSGAGVSGVTGEGISGVTGEGVGEAIGGLDGGGVATGIGDTGLDGVGGAVR